MVLKNFLKDLKALRKKAKWFSPVSRTDNILEKEIPEEKRGHKFKVYKASYKKYKYIKKFHITLKILFYAGVITSVAAVVGLELGFIQQISSYIGVTLLFILYGITYYFAVRAKEDFYLRREMMLSSYNEE